jgi:hypothetical protein
VYVATNDNPQYLGPLTNEQVCYQQTSHRWKRKIEWKQQMRSAVTRRLPPKLRDQLAPPVSTPRIFTTCAMRSVPSRSFPIFRLSSLEHH